jgi:RluA family pseudouridine synthase
LTPADIVTLYEDENIIAIDKPEGLCSIPERLEKKTDLLSLLAVKLGLKPYVVHRLDRDVSGIILFAKNAAAHASLNEQFSGRTMRKSYKAVVHGKPENENGKIEKPIRKFGSGRMGIDARNGKEATTLYSVEKLFGNASLLHVSPVSGRRHQIRVHLYSIGHAILGDTLYGERLLQKNFPRLMLHAAAIEFKQLSGEVLKLKSPLPASFEAVLNSLPAQSKTKPR